MAGARDIEGIDAGVPFALAAARVVEVRAQELFDHSAGVLDTSEIEGVHDMRVASRRLRAVLEIFAACFPRGLHASVLTDVKAIADALGERRDPDVHIDAMERFASEADPADRPGIETLVAELRAEQAAANARLEAALGRLEESQLRERLAELVAGARERWGPPEPLHEAVSPNGGGPAAAEPAA